MINRRLGSIVLFEQNYDTFFVTRGDQLVIKKTRVIKAPFNRHVSCIDTIVFFKRLDQSEYIGYMEGETP
jgi:hypothetical protein